VVQLWPVGIEQLAPKKAITSWQRTGMHRAGKTFKTYETENVLMGASALLEAIKSRTTSRDLH
jgi:hypothetical protein